MLVSDVITRSSNTELKQLKVNADDPTMIGYINESILEIYKRFNLWQAEAIITQVEDTFTYLMDGSDGNVSIDLSDNLLLFIDEIIDDAGAHYTINDELDEFGATTPRYDVIEFIEVTDAQEVSVIYRASPIDLTATTDEVPLPPQFLAPLYFYMGFRAHVSQKGGKDTENNIHWQRYDQACKEIQFFGLTSQDTTESHKFENNVYP